MRREFHSYLICTRDRLYSNETSAKASVAKVSSSSPRLYSKDGDSAVREEPARASVVDEKESTGEGLEAEAR